jgi:hypothetical protein
MNRLNDFMRGASLLASVALLAAPVLAEGKGDRAQKAIAEAQGKVDAAGKAGAAWTPDLQSRAEAALRAAHEDVSAGHKEQAIADANRASELADMVIGHAAQARDAATSAQIANAAAQTAAAQQQAQDAQQQAAAASQDAAAANARADAAQQQAAAAQQQAAAAVTTAPATTTVTTVEKDAHTQVASSAPAKPVHHVVRKSGATHAVTEKSTTTTVTTTPATTTAVVTPQ